jgi:hypothetical protein
MQWKRPVDHVRSAAPGREGFMFTAPCCWYAAGGGAVGGAPVLNLLYASGGAEGYIAWEYDLLFMREGRRTRQDLVPLLMILSTTPGRQAPGGDSTRESPASHAVALNNAPRLKLPPLGLL